MAIFDIFSKRQKALRGDLPDVYTYDKIPNPLKVQIIHIWRDALGDMESYNDTDLEVKPAYTFIVESLCREYGLFVLPGKKEYGYRHHFSELVNFLLHEEDAEKVLEAIELSFKIIDRSTRRWEYRHIFNYDEVADDAIIELNARFREHGVGYDFNGEIIRVDSQLLHAEAVKPALDLLRNPEFRGAQAEFLSAYEHYRHSRERRH